MRKRLLVGTVFANDSVDQARWLALQIGYLKATISDFHHVTFIPSCTGLPSRIFRANTEVLPNESDGNATSNHAHVLGLKQLLSYFKLVRENYSHFLIIDSDAFPIRTDWYELLCNRMGDRYEIAIAVRPENIEQRLHASILFANTQALDNLSWEVRASGLDLVGEAEHDVTVPHYQFSNRERVYSLVRSNQLNVHPLLCGVYYDMFYHHGCGSGRSFVVRSQKYWSHVTSGDVDVGALTQQLMNDPTTFINRLAGWSTPCYATPDINWPHSRARNWS